MRKKGLEVSKKDSFGVDGFDSKKTRKSVNFRLSSHTVKTLTFVSSL